VGYVYAAEAIKKMFSYAWKFLKSVEVPAFGGSLAAWGVALFFVFLSLRLVGIAFGGLGSVTPRTGSTRNPRISKERQGDTH